MPSGMPQVPCYERAFRRWPWSNLEFHRRLLEYGIVLLAAKSMIYKYFTAKSLLFKDLARILRLSL